MSWVSGALEPDAILAAANAVHLHTAGASAISGSSALGPANASHLHRASVSGLALSASLAPAAATHAHTAGLTGLVKPWRGLSYFVIGVWNASTADISSIASRGIGVNTLFTNQDDFTGGQNTGPSHRVAVAAAGWKMSVMPGRRFASDGSEPNQPGSVTLASATFLSDIDDTTVLFHAVIDECDGGGNLAAGSVANLIGSLNASAVAAGKTPKPWYQNNVLLGYFYPSEGARAFMNTPANVRSADTYWNLQQPNVRRLQGRADYGDLYTSPLEGRGVRDFKIRPYTTPGGTAATIANGQPYFAYLAGCKTTNTDPGATPAQAAGQVWSAVTHGADGVQYFITKTDTPFITDAMASFDTSLVATWQDFYRCIQILQAQGVLMDPAGGRAPFTTRLSAPATSGAVGSDIGPQDSGATYTAATGTQLQGGFEGFEATKPDGSGAVRVVHNFTADTLVLNDTTWGISALTLAPGARRAWLVSNPSVNLFALPVISSANCAHAHTAAASSLGVVGTVTPANAKHLMLVGTSVIALTLPYTPSVIRTHVADGRDGGDYVLKAPGSVLDYPIQYVLEADEAITSSTWSMTPVEAGGAAIVTGSALISGAVVACMLSGGNPGTRYVLQNDALTSKGRTYETVLTFLIGPVEA